MLTPYTFSSVLRATIQKSGPQTSSISNTWKLVEMQTLRAQPRPTESETLGWGPARSLTGSLGDSAAPGV